jgi:hypothetical protein
MSVSFPSSTHGVGRRKYNLLFFKTSAEASSTYCCPQVRRITNANETQKPTHASETPPNKERPRLAITIERTNLLADIRVGPGFRPTIRY